MDCNVIKRAKVRPVGGRAVGSRNQLNIRLAGHPLTVSGEGYGQGIGLVLRQVYGKDAGVRANAA